MKFKVIDRVKPPVDTLVLFSFETKLLPGWEVIDKTLEKKFQEALKFESYKGKGGTLFGFYPGKPARCVIAAGLDEEKNFTTEQLRRACATVAGRLKSLKTRQLHLLFPQTKKATGLELAHAIAEGFELAIYNFDRYKTKKEDHFDPGNVTITIICSGNLSDMKTGIEKGQVYSASTCFTRDLINEPGGEMTPRILAQVAQKVCRDSAIEIKVFDERAIEKMGMGAFRAVSMGSSQPPRFVHMQYKSPGAKKSVAIIGKGITFDSGGLCIKPWEAMLDMKNDMSGAAAVIGVFKALRKLRPRVNVHGIFPATENMPGGSAYKQRDVLKAMNGKTIEVTHTDAEGRLILSDALAYASRLKPDVIIDMATLTGACMIALGPRISGIFGTDQKLVDTLAECGRKEGEKIWQLPLEDEYFQDMMKSDVADMKNSGGRYAGAITGACFLKQFVDPRIPWVHIDIAGSCSVDSSKFYNPAGATGVMVRTILRYLESLS